MTASNTDMNPTEECAPKLPTELEPSTPPDVHVLQDMFQQVPLSKIESVLQHCHNDIHEAIEVLIREA